MGSKLPQPVPSHLKGRQPTSPPPPQPQMRLSAELRELRELLEKNREEDRRERAALRNHANEIQRNIDVLSAALKDSIARMERARDILSSGGGNWGMLDTKSLHEAIFKVEANTQNDT